ncbi:sigma-70 family RNA polymerase sigma factor [Hathewaya massiliensis]|uniref:sigma-70 family RNA polymerase sigma factor n=1 Tax=Hathewaya massiliensis TaxID=1964382 RepID=UPI001158EC07|nr:sigma-70 family RNA polymerase sigma factor [Hathewaya massiliensis]
MCSESNRDLVLKAKEGDLEARNMLIENNLALITKVAKEIKTKTNTLMDQEELVAEAALNIDACIRNYNPKYEFSTYLWHSSKGYMMKAIYKFQKELNMSLKNRIKIESLQEIIINFESKDITYEDILGGYVDTEDRAIKNLEIRDVWSKLNLLYPREKQAITLRYICDMTYQEIGEREGYSRETARKLINAGLEKVRSYF